MPGRAGISDCPQGLCDSQHVELMVTQKVLRGQISGRAGIMDCTQELCGFRMWSLQHIEGL